MMAAAVRSDGLKSADLPRVHELLVEGGTAPAVWARYFTRLSLLLCLKDKSVSKALESRYHPVPAEEEVARLLEKLNTLALQQELLLGLADYAFDPKRFAFDPKRFGADGPAFTPKGKHSPRPHLPCSACSACLPACPACLLTPPRCDVQWWC